MPLSNTYNFIANHPLTKDQKISAIKRWLKWQIGSRLVPGPVAVPYVDDTRLLVSPGMTGATGNIYCGLHEFEDMAFVLHFLRPGDLFVDIGANIGSYTILASATGAEIVSFEPVPSTYQHLLDNIQINRLESRVVAYNQAVGSQQGELGMIADQDTTNQVLLSGDEYTGEKVSVPVVALDDVLEGRVPKLIKIDVEGFETEVIDGAKDILSNNHLKAIIMELNGSGERYGFDEDGLHEKMLSLGFRSYVYEPVGRKITDLKGQRSASGNTLYLRDPEDAVNVVRQSKIYSVQQFSI